MANRSKYSEKTKLKMTKIFLENEYSYGEMSSLHGIPRTTMARWVNLYKAEGPDGFKISHKGNSNGRRPKTVPKFEPKANETLEKENERLRAENDYLKKLHALVQERQAREKRQKQSGN